MSSQHPEGGGRGPRSSSIYATLEANLGYLRLSWFIFVVVVVLFALKKKKPRMADSFSPSTQEEEPCGSV